MRMVLPRDPGPGLTHNKNIVAPKMTTAVDIPSQGKWGLSSSAGAPPLCGVQTVGPSVVEQYLTVSWI